MEIPFQLHGSPKPTIPNELCDPPLIQGTGRQKRCGLGRWSHVRRQTTTCAQRMRSVPTAHDDATCCTHEPYFAAPELFLSLDCESLPSSASLMSWLLLAFRVTALSPCKSVVYQLPRQRVSLEINTPIACKLRMRLERVSNLLAKSAIAMPISQTMNPVRTSSTFVSLLFFSSFSLSCRPQMSDGPTATLPYRLTHRSGPAVTGRWIETTSIVELAQPRRLASVVHQDQNHDLDECNPLSLLQVTSAP